jgi:putative transposase
VPRARLIGADGRTSEWTSASPRAYQRRTRAANALIGGGLSFRDEHPSPLRQALAVFAGGRQRSDRPDVGGG